MSCFIKSKREKLYHNWHLIRSDWVKRDNGVECEAQNLGELGWFVFKNQCGQHYSFINYNVKQTMQLFYNSITKLTLYIMHHVN